MSDFKLVKLLGSVPLAITIDNDGLLNNFGATAAPTVNDDTGDGYAVGSRWINVNTDEAYICLDATAGAAVWKQTTYEDEEAQDAVGGILTDSATIDFTYNDGAPSISAVVIAGSLDNSHISASAAIAYSKLAALTASRALVSDGSGVVSVSAVTSTELGYVSGVTSAIQTQLNNKQPLDATLTALAAYNTNGLIAQTAADTFAGRTITAGTGISVADGDGVAGNPTISCTITQYTDELAQDAVGGALVDSSSIDFTYNDGANTITAVVLPAGVDHDSLLNFVANEHVDHSSVSIITGATSGLSGGGDLTASRTLLVAPNLATSDTVASGDEILFADVSAANALKKTTAGAIAALGDFANKTLSNLTAPTAVSESLTMAAGKTVQLKNDVALQGRNQLDSAWVDMIKVGTSGQIVIGNSTNNFSSGNFLSTTHNTHTLGTAAIYWSEVYAVIANVGGGTIGLQTSPAGNAGVSALAGLAGIDVGLWTANSSAADAVATRFVDIGTGNKTAGTGNTGNITLRIGTSAGGTRGKIRLQDGSEGTAGHLWQSTSTGGEGAWASVGSVFTGLSADTPATADYIPFYDTSGGDANKSTIANMQVAFWQTVPDVAQVKTDGTGTHATLMAASLDVAIKTVLIFPGTHNIDNSVSPLNIGSKTYVGIGGAKKTIITRTDKTKAAITLTPNGNLTGVQLGDGSASENTATEFFARYISSVTTTAIYKDIVVQAGYGILIRNSTGLTLQDITSNGNFSTFNPTVAIQVGDASTTSPPILSIRNCSMNLSLKSLVTIYNCSSVGVFNLVTDFSISGSIAVDILSTCTGTVSLFNCNHGSVDVGVRIDGTSGAVVEITGDSFASAIGTANIVATNGATIALQGPSIYKVAGSYYTNDGSCTYKGAFFNKTDNTFTRITPATYPQRIITGTTTLDCSKSVVLCNSASAITVNLPPAADCPDLSIIIKNINTGLVTVDANASETIDDLTTQTLNQYDSMRIISDGTEWWIL